MPTRSAQVIIAAAIGDVFAEVPATWMTIMEQVSVGPVGIGARFARHGTPVTYWDVVEYEPPLRFAIEHRRREESLPFVYRYVLVAQPAGTLVRLEAGVRFPVLTIVFKLGLFAPFVLAAVVAQLRKLDVQTLLRDLKQRVEVSAS